MNLSHQDEESKSSPYLASAFQHRYRESTFFLIHSLKIVEEHRSSLYYYSYWYINTIPSFLGDDEFSFLDTKRERNNERVRIERENECSRTSSSSEWEFVYNFNYIIASKGWKSVLILPLQSWYCVVLVRLVIREFSNLEAGFSCFMRFRPDS